MHVSVFPMQKYSLATPRCEVDYCNGGVARVSSPICDNNSEMEHVASISKMRKLSTYRDWQTTDSACCLLKTSIFFPFYINGFICQIINQVKNILILRRRVWLMDNVSWQNKNIRKYWAVVSVSNRNGQNWFYSDLISKPNRKCDF